MLRTPALGSEVGATNHGSVFTDREERVVYFFHLDGKKH